MANIVTLKAVRAQAIKFSNQIESGSVQIHFENKYSYNVKYAANGNICRGEFTVKAYDKELGDKFSCEITLVGMFAYNPDATKDAIHRATYKELFPHVRATMISVTATAGIPPILLPAVDIDEQSVYSFDMPNPPQS